MKYQAEYRTVSGKFFQREFANKEDFETAKGDFNRSKRQGVDSWTDQIEANEQTDAGEMTFMIAMDKVEAVIFFAQEDNVETDTTGEA